VTNVAIFPLPKPLRTITNRFRLSALFSFHQRFGDQVQVLRRALSLSRMNFTLASATGDQIVDFAFSRSGDEVFCLSASGSIYRVINLRCSPDSKPQVSQQPLVMLPDVDDNFGSDGYALLSLECGPANCTLLVLGGSGGILYHCLILPRTEDIDVEPEIYVFEQLMLRLTYFDVTDPGDDIRCPIVLQRDPSLPNRYFAHHDSGVHVIVIPFVERLLSFVQQEDTNISTDVLESSIDMVCSSGPATSLVEQVVCTRANEMAALDAPPGLCVIPALPSPWLAVLTSGLNVVNIPLSRYRFSDNLVQKTLLTEEPLSESVRNGLPPTDFEREVKMILTGSRVPVLAQADKVTSPKELLELALQTTQRFREQHFAQLVAVKELIEETSRSLRETKESQMKELSQLGMELDEVTEQAERLKEKLKNVEDDKRNLMCRLHDVIQTVQRKNPSAANPQMVQEIRALYERMNRLESVLETTRDRADEFRELDQLEDVLERRSTRARVPLESLGENQCVVLEARLKLNGHEIGKMVREVKELLAQMD
ncbi:hypothetical protein BIW11_05475, partial [Tropilaelaps mercedesae]